MRRLEATLRVALRETATRLFSPARREPPLRRAGFRRCWWQPAVRMAGLDGLKLHELRHTFVALWVDAGAGVKEVSVRADHSFTLDHYGYLYEDRSDALADRLNELLEDRAAHMLHAE